MPGEFWTERLWAHPMAFDDVDLLVDLNSDGEVMRFLTGRPMSRDESVAELNDSLGTRWLLFSSADDRFVGWVGAVATGYDGEFDVGWRLCRSAWGNGFASEAARALIDHLFAEGAHRVVATTMAVNVLSRAVMHRIGLSFVRTFHPEFDDPLPGTEQGEVEYGVTRSEWEQQRLG